ncbi:MAG: hypothetical protein V7L20_15310 [Nostoc sp.]
MLLRLKDNSKRTDTNNYQIIRLSSFSRMISSVLQNNLDIRLVLEDGEKVDSKIVKAWQSIH